MKRRESWGDSKHLGVVRTVGGEWKLWTLRVGGGSVSYPFASRLRENTAAPYVPGTLLFHANVKNFKASDCFDHRNCRCSAPQRYSKLFVRLFCHIQKLFYDEEIIDL
ncbi:hypothetical protein DITRI_Ditri10aG0190600 [Diplodiscus trichospermus]